jgi:EAL domain-containing protein (putative c-di-GMP-specific phosphodiesterase class I)
MDIAESSGLIINIGSRVMYETCRQLREWQKKSGCLYQLAVNLSALQFNHKYLPVHLDATGIATETLELEITETVVPRT